MSIHTQFDKKTYSDFFWYDNFSDTKKVLLLGLMDLLLFGLFIYSAITQEQKGMWLFLALGLAVPVLYFSVLSIRLYRRLKASGLNEASLHVSYEIDKKQIVSRNEQTKKDKAFTWQQIAKTKETKHYFYLYIAKNHAMVLKKEDMSAKQVAELAKWAVSAQTQKKRMGEIKPMLKR